MANPAELQAHQQRLEKKMDKMENLLDSADYSKMKGQSMMAFLWSYIFILFDDVKRGERKIQEKLKMSGSIYLGGA